MDHKRLEPEPGYKPDSFNGEPRVAIPEDAKAVRDAVNAERQACHDIAMALDSNRGNEKEIAAAILKRMN